MATRGLWPTATAGDAKSSGSRNTPGSNAHPGTSLTDAVRQDGGTGRDGGTSTQPTENPVLNPSWVEWLMGMPTWWTALTASEELVTRKFREWWWKHGEI